jgi:hypothetical protein
VGSCKRLSSRINKVTPGGSRSPQPAASERAVCWVASVCPSDRRCCSSALGRSTPSACGSKSSSCSWTTVSGSSRSCMPRPADCYLRGGLRATCSRRRRTPICTRAISCDALHQRRRDRRAEGSASGVGAAVPRVQNRASTATNTSVEAIARARTRMSGATQRVHEGSATGSRRGRSG